MPSVCFYFQVHQPFRVKKFGIFDIGHDHNYFNDNGESKLNNLMILEKVARKSYLPTNKLLLELLHKHPEFKITFSMSGVLLEALERHLPEVLQSFKDLVATGRVDLLGETYYHTLAFLYSKEEFRKQILLHRDMIEDIFDYTPIVFRNTELIYSNDLAKDISEMGFKGMLGEGADHILGWRSPNFVYHAHELENLKLLLKNYKLSDDIAFRFSTPDWSEYPLTADKYANWITDINGNGQIVNLFMDYETFGEHQWEETGIFNFLRALPGELLKNQDNDFVTVRDIIDRYPAVASVDVPHYLSWADIERDLSAWRSNAIQHDALSKLYALEKPILESGDTILIDDWRKLQTSDHFYYMCTKWFNDGDVHKYFNPYDSPYEAFITYMNVINDLKVRAGVCE